MIDEGKKSILAHDAKLRARMEALKRIRTGIEKVFGEYGDETGIRKPVLFSKLEKILNGSGIAKKTKGKSKLHAPTVTSE